MNGAPEYSHRLPAGRSPSPYEPYRFAHQVARLAREEERVFNRFGEQA
jgi:hypothetical protein